VRKAVGTVVEMTSLNELLLCAKSGTDDFAEQFLLPDWSASRFRWEFYVPVCVREAWGRLSSDARAVAYVCALEALSSDDPDAEDE
jgi:hypothetical protein